MRKVYVDFRGTLIIRANEDVNIERVLECMEWTFDSHTEGANIENIEIMDATISDSK